MALETLMKYTITADASKAKAEIAGVDKALKTSGGTLSSVAQSASKEWGSIDGIIGKVKGTIGGIPVPAGAAAGAIAGIGAAALGAAAGIAAIGKAMFEMAKSGSDFGRNIGSFESKTGLTAQTVSALAYAAKLSGKELSDLQRPMIAFTGALGKAQVAGSDASKALEKLGITDVHNLDAALSQAFAALNKMPDGIDKMNVAAQLFGKRGGLEMINFAKKTGSSFDEFKAKAEALGVVLSEQEVRHAKEFGHAFETLGYQIEAVAAKFGIEWAPVFTDGMEKISGAIKHHKPEIDHAITSSGDLLRGIAVVSTDSTVSSVASWTWWAASLMSSGFLPVQKGAELATDALRRLGAAQRGLEVGGKVGAGLFGSTTFGKLGGTYGTSTITGLPGEDDGEGGGKGGAGKAKEHKLSPQAKSIISHANALGVSPLDLATMMLYETAGTLSTSIMGGKGGKYGGLIQFGPSERKQFGAYAGQPFDAQMDAVSRYLIARGVTPGSDLLTMYKAVNGGNVGVSGDASDGSGTIRQHVARMLAQSSGKARSLLGMGKADEWGGEFGKLYKELDPSKGIMDQAKSTYDMATKYLARWNEAEKAAIDQRLELRRGEAGVAEEILKSQLIAGTIDEKEYTERIGALKIAALRDERDELVEQTNESEKAYKLSILDLAIRKQAKQNENEIAEIIKRQNAALEEQWAAAQGSRKANQRPYGMATRRQGSSGNDFADGLFGTIGIEKFTSQADMMTSTMVRMGQIGGEAIHGLADAMGSLVEQWVMTGHMSGKAAKQALASAFAMASAQAMVSAIMETAYGIAALTPWGAALYGPASFHFKSAAMFALLAAGTGLIGRGIAGNSGGSAAGSTGASSTPIQSAPITTYSRTSSNAYLSGGDSGVHALATEVRSLREQIGSMRPGDVVTVAAQQNPGIIGNQTHQDIRNGHTDGVRMYRDMGGR